MQVQKTGKNSFQTMSSYKNPSYTCKYIKGVNITVLLYLQTLMAWFLTYLHNFTIPIFTSPTLVQIIIVCLPYYMFRLTILDIYKQRTLRHDLKNADLHNSIKNIELYI